MNLNIDVRGDDRVREMLRRINQQLAQQALAATAVQAEDYVEAAAAVHTRTGALVQSIYKTRIRPLAWEIGHNRQQAPQALFVHWGTRPHVIEGSSISPRKVYPKPPNKVLGGIFRAWYMKDRKSLRWAGPGGFRFASKVNHPGYKGDPWLVRAAREAPRNFEQHVAQMLRDI